MTVTLRTLHTRDPSGWFGPTRQAKPDQLPEGHEAFSEPCQGSHPFCFAVAVSARRIPNPLAAHYRWGSLALKARPGDITSEELEKKKGGSGLRYSFGVKSGKALYEVGVDAQTGKVLENSNEGKNRD